MALDGTAMGVRLLCDRVGMTDRTPIAFQSHTNRTMREGISNRLLYGKSEKGIRQERKQVKERRRVKISLPATGESLCDAVIS